MKIIVDENMPYGKEAFSTLGEVVTMPGRAMDAAAVADADILAIRSVTKVNAALLDGSKVRFVGTATIGEDHVDKAYLEEKGIGFSSAPGCNANSVGQYITAALLELAEAYDFQLRSTKLGIVGVGNVGSRVLEKASAMGMECILNDPPLERETGDAKYRPIEEIFDCDIVTIHVPLTKAGPNPTYHLVEEIFLRQMKPGSILVNSSRGAVVDNVALKKALLNGYLEACVLDVWEGEPVVDLELLEQAFIGTPHIAGYSFDGKVNGTRQIYEAACVFFGREPVWDPSPLLPAPACPEVRVAGATSAPEAALREAVRKVYDIRQDDKAMRRLFEMVQSDRGAFFDTLRKNYPVRREFFNTRAVINPRNPELEAMFSGVGFQCEE
ncbi:MAG: 4-phosphoerythronate dehydrogenase PdxB [Candidatus Hydrogenedentota bacterium]